MNLKELSPERKKLVRYTTWAVIAAICILFIWATGGVIDKGLEAVRSIRPDTTLENRIEQLEQRVDFLEQQCLTSNKVTKN